MNGQDTHRLVAAQFAGDQAKNDEEEEEAQHQTQKKASGISRTPVGSFSRGGEHGHSEKERGKEGEHDWSCWLRGRIIF